jgi:alanyl-tRNA synthetase/REP element-mobilizing transposase RayT
MLGNWSFGDYFKKEAIEWAWELVVGRWKFPPQRLYATIYQPDKSLGDPAERDEEAYNFWAEKFRAAGLDPAAHIINGNKKDNFWMMGDTGPCGPCSELHMDLTPAGDTRGALVNKGSAECIEIWNLVFIQFNANPDGSFTPLPAQHVDTGMGFERVASIIQGTKGFSNFANANISNYETDIFRPIFDEIEALSGKTYASTLPGRVGILPAVTGVPPGTTTNATQNASQGGRDAHPTREQCDIAFRVIADHIRTLSFAIADGIQPGNTDRNYVLRRILRRAVKYGRTLGFHEPFFYKLVDVLARTMGDVFPEIRAKQKHVEEVLRREEEAFNRTLDKGIALFEAEAAALSGRVGVPPAGSGILPEPISPGATYTRRRSLPHFEKPWAIYAVAFTTIPGRTLSPDDRAIIIDALRHFHGSRYELFAACVMPDHVHLLLQPWIKETEGDAQPLFWSLGELMHSIKSYTAKEINKRSGATGSLWEQERFDRYVRGDRDLAEKFHYIVENPWRAGLADAQGDYAWVWSPGDELEKGSGRMPEPAGGTPTLPGSFAFRLYDEQGFPLDLTELMARERGLAVDVAGFEKLMNGQRARARAAQKKQVIELSEVETKDPTRFVGYELLSTPAKVLEVVSIKDKTAVVLDASSAYAEMGGQVGDTGELSHGADVWRIAGTQKAGHTWLHFLDSEDAPSVGAGVTLRVDASRRAAIQRHHSVTHLLHWALHEVVSRDATQKGSFVGPEKLTFDFNGQALTPAQVRDIERLVNERIVDNAGISWVEMPYADVRGRADIMQFFGDKYGETVRVVQIGGAARALDGYSMELCAGTHARATGEIGLFRILGEAAIAAGVRRIEAVAGLEASDHAVRDGERLVLIASQLNSPVAEIEKKIGALLAHQKDLEKSLKSARAREAAARAKELVRGAEQMGDIPFLAADLGPVDGDYLQAVADALKGEFSGVCLFAGTANNAVALVATVSPEFTSRVQAGKIIQAVAPLVGGKGGGKPDAARGGGKDASGVTQALSHAKTLLV